jgi:hypothetical protein
MRVSESIHLHFRAASRAALHTRRIYLASLVEKCERIKPTSSSGRAKKEGKKNL